MAYITGSYTYSPNGGAYTSTTALFDRVPIDYIAVDGATWVSCVSDIVSTTGGGCELLVTDWTSLTANVDLGGIYALDALYYGYQLRGVATHGSIGFCSGGGSWADFPNAAYEASGLTAQHSLDGTSWTSITAGLQPVGPGGLPSENGFTAAISPPITASYARLIGSVRMGTWIVVGTLAASLRFSDFRFTGVSATASCIDITSTPVVSAGLSCCGKRQTVAWDAVAEAATYSLYHRVPVLSSAWQAVATATTDTAYAYAVPPYERPYAHQWGVVPTNDCGNGPTGTVGVGPLYGGGSCQGGGFTAGSCAAGGFTAGTCVGGTWTYPDCDG